MTRLRHTPRPRSSRMRDEIRLTLVTNERAAARAERLTRRANQARTRRPEEVTNPMSTITLPSGITLDVPDEVATAIAMAATGNDPRRLVKVTDKRPATTKVTSKPRLPAADEWTTIEDPFVHELQRRKHDLHDSKGNFVHARSDDVRGLTTKDIRSMVADAPTIPTETAAAVATNLMERHDRLAVAREAYAVYVEAAPEGHKQRLARKAYAIAMNGSHDFTPVEDELERLLFEDEDELV